MKAGTLL